MATTNNSQPVETLRTLPGDEVRQIMWRYSDRYDMQMAVQAARSVARGLVARLVADGVRNTHDWNARKEEMLQAMDDAGITAAFMDVEDGGYIPGPKNLVLSLVAFELAWVDGGAATGSLAGNLALSPIHECGTDEQRHFYMTMACPPKPGENRKVWRGAFALTEPLPYVGVETGLLSGKIRVAEWKDGAEPVLQVEKRGRFITNMGFANFVTAAVDTDDPKIKSSCMVILHNDDPGTWDPGVATKKLVHQLSSTTDPVLSLKVPANRIIGGYTIKDGVIVPNLSHGDVIEAVFSHTRVTVGLMTAAKLLSAIEPVIRYHRTRFRGGGSATAGTPRYDLGLQTKEDALQRLVDVWATGEAAASLGFATARLFDELDPLTKQKDNIFAEKNISGARAQFKVIAKIEKDAMEYLRLSKLPENERGANFAALEADPLLPYVLRASQANVLCPACKLWNTGHGANVMREAVSLVGGYGITEDCPGFLGHKWMDAQLEATYEGPEAVQRRQMSVTMTNELFLAQYTDWIAEMRRIGGERPGTGACALATAMQLWKWTLAHLQEATDAGGRKLYHGNRHGVTFPLADALCWLLAARQLILDVLELEAKGAQNPSVAEALPGLMRFYTDLAHAQVARAAGEVGRVCAELVYGYNRHPSWDAAGMAACFNEGELEQMETIMPGIAGAARAYGEVAEKGQEHPLKPGPCVHFDGMDEFVRLRTKLDGCLTGSRLAKDRAAEALTRVMIPEALDYPV
jgi:alkylation response protein AidB-like acyl-CoA dehydrogenase